MKLCNAGVGVKCGVKFLDGPSKDAGKNHHGEGELHGGFSAQSLAFAPGK
jgi:hypothetical protein